MSKVFWTLLDPLHANNTLQPSMQTYLTTYSTDFKLRTILEEYC